MANDAEILKACSTPKTFADLSKKFGTNGYDLGIKLGRLIIAGKLRMRNPIRFATEAPVYYTEKLPKKFTFPLRKVPLRQLPAFDE